MTEYTPAAPAVAVEERSFIQRVFAWMTLGLAITGVVAWALGTNDGFVDWFSEQTWLFFALIVVEFLCVAALAAFVQRISAAMASLLFLAYAALNGVTFSLLFALFTSESIFVTFLVAGGMFGAMAAIGWTTKRDLSGLGSLLFMGLIGLILASVVNLFWASSGLYWVTTYAGVVIFAGLTAYDMQKLKALNVPGNADTEEDHKEAISGALALYLDFINLFLFLLRIFGRSK